MTERQAWVLVVALVVAFLARVVWDGIEISPSGRSVFLGDPAETQT